jgi:hypothetical protein
VYICEICGLEKETDMEDLVPLLIFVVIALVNFLKYLAEKGGKPKQAPNAPEGAPRKREPRSLEEFFEELAEKAEPQPTELPAWPTSRKRPDYVREMEEFERSQEVVLAEESRTAEIMPLPTVAPAEPPPAAPLQPPAIPTLDKVTAIKSPLQSTPAIFSNMRGIRMHSAPILPSEAKGKTEFDLQGRKNLKQAILAHVIFSPPRAYDLTFENTISPQR